MPTGRNSLDPAKFNNAALLPYELRLEDFRLAVQDVYDFFRKNARGELGTRTATLHAAGIAKLRQNWIYRG